METYIETIRPVAIGEIGLDYYYEEPPRDIQREAFIYQLKLAAKYDLPVIIHSREAAMETFDIMKEYGPDKKGKFSPDLGKMARLGEEGVFMLLSDSTEAERPGHTTSETVISDQLAKTFHATEGRIIVALYASNFIRIQQVFTQAQDAYRKVAVVGKALEKVLELGIELGYLDVGEDTFIPVNDIHKYQDDEIVILRVIRVQ